MSKAIQVRIDEEIKLTADQLFKNLGLDTSTAIRMFLVAAIESGGIPFEIRSKKPSSKLHKAIEDTCKKRDLHGPYKTAQEAVKAMLKD
jgi:DNA-damage-inducible protein J